MERGFKVTRVIKAGAILVFAVALTQTGVAGNKNIKKLIHLDAGTAEPNANGIAKISAKLKINKPKQDFQVVGANLKASDTYDLFVDGVKIASQVAKHEQGEDDDMDATAGSSGAVEFLFSSKAHTDDSGEGGPLPLPPSLDPVTNIKKVEIKNAAGIVVLSGEFS